MTRYIRLSQQVNKAANVPGGNVPTHLVVVELGARSINEYRYVAAISNGIAEMSLHGPILSRLAKGREYVNSIVSVLKQRRESELVAFK